MLLKGSKLTLMGAVGVVFAAGVALGDNHKFGIEYRAGVTYDDGKIHETEGVDAEDATFTEIDTEAVKVTASGEAAKDVNYMFRYNALNQQVELAHARMQLNKMTGFSVGRAKVNQGGWHAKNNWEEYNNTESRCGDTADKKAACQGDYAFAYANSQAFGAYDDVVAFHLALAGELTVQLLDDVQDNSYKNSSNKGPAATIEWVGNFGGWMPLVQISSYDLNNSQAFSLGVQGKVAGLGLALGYNVDNRKNFAGADDETDTYTGIDVHVDYGLGSWTPWLAFHSFDVKQGAADADVNSVLTKKGKDGVTTVTNTTSDNAQAIAVGVKCNALGDGYVPYATIVSSSGKFPEAGTGEEETRTGLALKVGVLGKF